MTAPQVGVLLPVRLETRFVAPRGPADTWRLRVRIVPDAVAVTVHDPVPTALELDAVTAMWRAAGGADLGTPEGRRGWRVLVAAVGVERAAWLARTFPPITGPTGEITVARPAEVREAMRRPRVLGLPPEIEIWLARGGHAPQRAATLTVKTDEIDLDFADPEGPHEAWWSSFPDAVRLGLAAELDLGAGDGRDIDVLYAVGIGGGDPGPLLGAHSDSGRLGLLAPGTATKSIDGRRAASSGDDPDEHLDVLRTAIAAQPGTRAVSQALAGAAPALPSVPGGAEHHAPLGRALMGALWPALWGHGLANVLGYAEQVDPLGVWAADNVVPEGPLPVLRIGAQPYGLLPATALGAWQAASGDPAVEAELVPLVRDLVARWAAIAERAVAGPTRRPFDILMRTPAAAAYGWRFMAPLEVAHAVAFRYGSEVRGAQMRQWWDRRAAETPHLGRAAPAPSARLVSVGWSQPLELDLVGREAPAAPAAPIGPAGALRRMGPPGPAGRPARPATSAPRPHPELRRLRAAPMREILDSPATTLLGELTRHSLAASAAAVARTAARQPRAIAEPLSADVNEPGELDTWALRFRAADLDAVRGPAAQVHRNVLAGLDVLAEWPASDVERALRAALDTATHRIDPWATAIAWRRLQSLAAAPRTLGLYAWVDSPRPRGTAPSSDYILAPSMDQAAVAALLRDRAMRDPDADRWQLDLTSDRVRGALRLATDVREGSHPAEALGRRVEEIVLVPRLVDALRDAFPLLPSLSRLELRVRRVCDGVAVLDAARENAGRLAQLGLTPAMIGSLQTLAGDADALGDLHVADAVHGLVRGRPETVAATTAAAAGLGLPSTLDVMRTPQGGRSVTSIALLLLPGGGGGAAAQSPMALADAAAAAYLDVRAGDTAGPDWTWTVLDAAGVPSGTVTLADAGLAPSDTIGLGADSLMQAVRDATGSADLARGPVPGHDRVRAMAAALAGVPALPEDVSVDSTPADLSAVVADLRTRLDAVRAAAGATISSLRIAAASAGSIDDRRDALRSAARWGITPLVTADTDPTGADLATRAEHAADALSRRLESVPPDATVAEMSAGGLAEQIAALVVPEGACPVLARLDAGLLADLQPDAPGTVAPAVSLDPEWLETVAPVRRSLARLEALQLDERLRPDGAPMDAWTSRPGAPWQVEVSLSSEGLPLPSRLLAAFGPTGVLPAPAGTAVAVAVLDRFVETIPDTNQDGAVAFRHDLPGARAPQSILLAVPPDVTEELTPETLVRIVAETRLLARARIADPTLLGPAAGVLHLAAIPAVGRAGVRLERGS